LVIQTEAYRLRIIVTGGAGFIGYNLVRYLTGQPDTCILNIDKLVFPGSYHTIKSLDSLPAEKYIFSLTDICNLAKINKLFEEFKPDVVMHLAAESHVDRSIDKPGSFIESNIIGTYNLLEAAKNYWYKLSEPGKKKFRFHHISTDEVFGSLDFEQTPFKEETPYSPNSPYSASKAAADHLVRAWYHTYGLPVVISNCSNNYGPYQFPEKLIPLMITKALKGEKLPVYGDGKNVRDWLFVEDHITALVQIMQNGITGENYNVGGNCEKSNNEIVENICQILDQLVPDSPYRPHKKLISYVTDRPGHDKRYAMDFTKLNSELGWKPNYSFDEGLLKTIKWYMDNLDWCNLVTENQYAGERLGLGK
jgi:dTDP-glucose 4,6-dehydratase